MKWPIVGMGESMELIRPSPEGELLIDEHIGPNDALGMLDPVNIDAIVKLTVERLPSANSRRAYARHLTDYLNWCSYSLSRTSVQQWVNVMRSKGLRGGTINQALSAIKSLAREAEAHDLLPANIVQPIMRVPGVVLKGNRAGNWLTLDQLNKLVAHPDRSTLGGLRDAVVLGLLAGCGLRRTEASYVKWSSYQERDGRMCLVDVEGKGGRIRTVAVPAWVENDLECWSTVAFPGDQRPQGAILRALARVRDTFVSSASVAAFGALANNERIRFESVHDKPLSITTSDDIGEGLTASGVWWVVKQHAIAIGLGDISPHDLRRTLAHLMRDAGAELEQIQHTLGHASVQTTELYVNARLELRKGRAAVDLVDVRTAEYGGDVQPQIIELDPPHDYDVLG